MADSAGRPPGWQSQDVTPIILHKRRQGQTPVLQLQLSIPAGSTVKGITVRLNAKADSTAGLPKICVQLSWNGRTSWTTAKSTATLGTTVQAFTLGGPTDTWGRSWSVNDLTNANFRLRVIDVASNVARDFSLDWAAVQVDY